MVKKDKVRKKIGWLIFYIYLVCMAYFLFFSERYGRIYRLEEYRYNLIPFTEIKRYFMYRDSFRVELFIVNMFGNVFAFAPFGFLLPLLEPRFRKFLNIAFLSFEVSLMVELVQLITKTGIFDVDDVILNTFGGILGYLCFLLCKQIVIICRKHSKKYVNGM